MVQRSAAHLSTSSEKGPIGGRPSPRHGRNRSGAWLHLGDVADGHRGPDGVVAAVVPAGDAVQGADIDGMGNAEGGSSSAPQATQLGMVLTSG